MESHDHTYTSYEIPYLTEYYDCYFTIDNLQTNSFQAEDSASFAMTSMFHHTTNSLILESESLAERCTAHQADWNSHHQRNS